MNLIVNTPQSESPHAKLVVSLDRLAPYFWSAVALNDINESTSNIVTLIEQNYEYEELCFIESIITVLEDFPSASLFYVQLLKQIFVKLPNFINTLFEKINERLNKIDIHPAKYISLVFFLGCWIRGTTNKYEDFDHMAQQLIIKDTEMESDDYLYNCVLCYLMFICCAPTKDLNEFVQRVDQQIEQLKNSNGIDSSDIIFKFHEFLSLDLQPDEFLLSLDEEIEIDSTMISNLNFQRPKINRRLGRVCSSLDLFDISSDYVHCMDLYLAKLWVDIVLNNYSTNLSRLSHCLKRFWPRFDVLDDSDAYGGMMTEHYKVVAEVLVERLINSGLSEEVNTILVSSLLVNLNVELFEDILISVIRKCLLNKNFTQKDYFMLGQIFAYYITSVDFHFSYESIEFVNELPRLTMFYDSFIATTLELTTPRKFIRRLGPSIHFFRNFMPVSLLFEFEGNVKDSTLYKAMIEGFASANYQNDFEQFLNSTIARFAKDPNLNTFVDTMLIFDEFLATIDNDIIKDSLLNSTKPLLQQFCLFCLCCFLSQISASHVLSEVQRIFMNEKIVVEWTPQITFDLISLHLLTFNRIDRLKMVLSSFIRWNLISVSDVEEFLKTFDTLKLNHFHECLILMLSQFLEAIPQRTQK
eukprot:TRINITY_DN2026_c0_g1_i1.p1 TRINITY_DN2026_c0_g1~~TRINITY_DN2026_c0_g1_i1.p1  ORF type:complete len:640 (+),score=154.18 TRINITY_DN2026_c0_g1_i1:45-1964(+)